MADSDNNVFDGHPDESETPPAPPPRVQSIDLSEARNHSISKSKSSNVFNSSTISSGSSGVDKSYLSANSEHVEHDVDSISECRTPPPVFNPPPVIVTDTEPNRPTTGIINFLITIT